MGDGAGRGGTDRFDEDSLESARRQERLHRELQHQGGAGRDDRPPLERARDEAIDEAMEDVRRAEREATEPRDARWSEDQSD